MTTLSTAPLSPLLDRLFADAEATTAAVMPAIMRIPAEERAAMMASKTDYRDFYMRMKDAHLAVSRETAALLYMLARSTGARTIAEFGTSFGISTLQLAAALRDNGGGRLITSEFEPSKVGHARANFAAGCLSDLIEIREGDALETLARDLPDQNRPYAARRRQGPLSGRPGARRGTPAAGRLHPRRQRGFEPGIPGPRSRARARLHVGAIRHRCRAVDAGRLNQSARGYPQTRSL
jgi:hypothetical protein